MAKSGSISVNTENIFPIIKKFLYSDHEIFLRELVSNATDACQKLSALNRMGEFKGELGDLKITIALDTDKKTLTISDNGIGMTEAEIEKYINQVAFSGAEEFVQKYKDKTDANVIGHFGLGFYSAFMVASKVEIQTLSYQDNAVSSAWSCDGSTEFKITKGKRKTRGTDIVLHIAEDSLSFNESLKIKQLLEKYCKFLPISIEFEGAIINADKPLWMSKPSDLKDEDYTAFYQKLYPFAPAPLFWIHINVDYPFNLTGILYFPKIGSAIEADKHKVQLYSNQVFVTDNVKDVLPEFLMLLHGVIDSPDIPLNVSRSSLQSDTNVKKITTHISKKVADKLSELFKQSRTDFESKWSNIDLFVKYGMLSDEKFAEKAKEFCLLSDAQDKSYTIDDYKQNIAALQTDKSGQLVVLYTNHLEEQYAYVKAAESRGYSVLKLEGPLDNHFTAYLEQHNDKLQCKRVDADALDKLIPHDKIETALLSDDQVKQLSELFEKGKQRADLTIVAEALSVSEPLITVTESEYDRRMRDMSKMNGFNMFGDMPIKYQGVVNTNHVKAKAILDMNESDAQALIKKAISLALLSKGLLKGADLNQFVQAEFEKL